MVFTTYLYKVVVRKLGNRLVFCFDDINVQHEGNAISENNTIYAALKIIAL